MMSNEIQQPHPCQYCQKLCYGKQCKDCHFKMIANRNGICYDCKKVFYALRKDGTKRKRCFDCQDIYNKNHIAICPDCNIEYHAYLEDGRMFEKCFTCYKKSFHKCQNCDNMIKDKFIICGECFKKEKELNQQNSFPLKECKNTNCDNQTTYLYCKPCNDSFKNNSDIRYKILVCQYPDCEFRVKEHFKFCDIHKPEEDEESI